MKSSDHLCQSRLRPNDECDERPADEAVPERPGQGKVQLLFPSTQNRGLSISLYIWPGVSVEKGYLLMGLVQGSLISTT